MVNERVGRLGKIMEETLSGREKTILIMRYGLDGKKEKTQRKLLSYTAFPALIFPGSKKGHWGKLRKKYEEIENASGKRK